jgi:hypothetical protein
MAGSRGNRVCGRLLSDLAAVAELGRVGRVFFWATALFGSNISTAIEINVITLVSWLEFND